VGAAPLHRFVALAARLHHLLLALQHTALVDHDDHDDHDHHDDHDDDHQQQQHHQHHTPALLD